MFRAYTPVTDDDARGYFDLVVKVYPRAPPRWPDGGKVGGALAALPLARAGGAPGAGGSVRVQGPFGRLRYRGRGRFALDGRALVGNPAVTDVGLVCAGSGLTPMLQLLAAVLKDRRDATRCHLVYANKTERDILCRGALERLHAAHADKFPTLWYTLSRPGDGAGGGGGEGKDAAEGKGGGGEGKAASGWAYGTGRVTEAMLRARLPAPGPRVLVLVCGPPGFDDACRAHLGAIGHAPERVVAY